MSFEAMLILSRYTRESFSWSRTTRVTSYHHTQASSRKGIRDSLELQNNQLMCVLSMFYYQSFHKAVWISKAAVFLNYQHIKMYLWTTKDCQVELLFSAVFQRENLGVIFKRLTLTLPSEQPNIPEDTGRNWHLPCQQRPLGLDIWPEIQHSRNSWSLGVSCTKRPGCVPPEKSPSQRQDCLVTAWKLPGNIVMFKIKSDLSENLCGLFFFSPWGRPAFTSVLEGS